MLQQKNALKDVIKNMKRDVPELFYKKYFYDEYLCLNKQDWEKFLEDEYYPIRNYVLYEYMHEKLKYNDCLHISQSVDKEYLEQIHTISMNVGPKSLPLCWKYTFHILRNNIPDFKKM
jgi:hypothetical protein